LTGLTAIWAGVHLQLARLADCPAIAMSEAEAKTFLQAWQNYLRHYSLTATQRTVDLMTAVGVTVFLYAPRGMALAERNRNGPPQRTQQGPAQVFRFHQPAQPAAPEPPPVDVEGVAEPVGGGVH
jgi:hypothetical protein